MKTKISLIISCLLGLALIFMGARFLISPEVGEMGYGIHFNEQGDYSFHYVKGIRDIFSGLIIFLLALTNERRALAFTLLMGSIIPTVDSCIVLSKSYTGFTQAIPHLAAIIILLVLGILLLVKRKAKKI